MGKKEERLISLVLLLQENPRLTFSEIITRLPAYRSCKSEDAARKMFERDRKELKDSGIEIVCKEGKEYAINLSYNISNISNLMASEKRILGEILSELLYFESTVNAEALNSAIRKIGMRFGILPLIYRVEPALNFMLPISDTEELFSKIINEAIEKNKKISFHYRPFNSVDYKEYVVCPYFLSLRDGEWYLVAERNGEVRNFKLKRMKDLRILDEDSEAFCENLEELAKSLYQKPWEYDGGNQIEVLVKCDRELQEIFVRKFNGEILEIGKDYCVLSFKVKSLERFLLHLAPFFAKIEILKPEELRERIKNQLEILLRVLESEK